MALVKFAPSIVILRGVCRKYRCLMWKHFWLWKSKEQGRSCPLLVGAGEDGTPNK